MRVLAEPDSKECVLLDDFGWFIQGALAFFSFSSLISNQYTVKRYLEKNPRC